MMCCRNAIASLVALSIVALVNPTEISAVQDSQTSAVEKPRRLVLCLDGTWGSAYNLAKRVDGDTVLKPTNPLKTCRAVIPFDKETGQVQISYYHIGIGALAQYPGGANRLLHFVDRTLGGISGAGFEENVEETLHFLALNHQPGDEVYIFGFSRGAATARAVTQFLAWNGGLPRKEDSYFLPILFRAFATGLGTKDARDQAMKDINAELERHNKPRLECCQDVRVVYLGVWDTVMALGSRFKAIGKSTSDTGWTFYVDPALPRCVARARQALAIDEARFDFRPEIWTSKLDNQRLEQRWFVGVHSNVGGGYVNDGLANIAFLWVLQGAEEEGLRIDPDFVRFYKPFFGDSLSDSSTPSYHVLDFFRSTVGRGKRELGGLNADIDPSVIQRMSADPGDVLDKNHKPMTKPYRPDYVLRFLACQPNLDAFIEKIQNPAHPLMPLPEDLKQRIDQLRPDCKRATRTALVSKKQQN